MIMITRLTGVDTGDAGDRDSAADALRFSRECMQMPL
jgi:hypothetical protein